MRTTALIHGGTYPQLATIKDPTLQANNIVPLYGRTMQPTDLDGYTNLIVSDRLHHKVLATIKPMVSNFLQQPGNKAIFFGEETAQLLDEITFTGHPTNFWAWRTGEDTGLRAINKDHYVWEYLSEMSTNWHFHGSYTPPATATSLLNLEVENNVVGSILYHDSQSYPAEIIVTTMDPVFHHGAEFMPGATQLLYHSIFWLRDKTAV